MYERFTDRARKVFGLAQQEAFRFNHEYIGTEHILLGLLREGSGNACKVLGELKVSTGAVREEIEKVVWTGPTKITVGKLPQTPTARSVVQYAIEEAKDLNHNYIGTEHILLGLLRESEGVAYQILTNIGLAAERVRGEVLRVLGRTEPVKEAEGPLGKMSLTLSTAVDEIRNLQASLALFQKRLAKLQGALESIQGFTWKVRVRTKEGK